MKALKHHLLIYLTILTVFAIIRTICQAQFTEHGCDDEYGNYTSNSQYSKNLRTLFSSITSNTHIDYGFYNLSVGRDLDIVNGLALCRGDIRTTDCKACIRNATIKILSLCPNQKSAFGWYETCMLWYSAHNIFMGQLSLPLYFKPSGRKASNPETYNHTVATLMDRLANQAALGDSRRKFATGEANISSTAKVYGLVQCIPEIEDFDCLNCFREAINYTLADCCYGDLGVEAASLNCQIRFENYRFYKSAVVLPPLQSPAPPPFLSLPPPPPTFTTSKKGNRSKTIRMTVATGIPILGSLVIIVILMVCYFKRRRVSSVKTKNEVEDDSGLVESLRLDFNIVKTATDNFSNSNKLGQGGFGTIYKGIIPSTGQAIAVKRLSNNSDQGEKEFQSEVLLLTKLQHRNLVKCLGYSLTKSERLLVYEFLPNKSLDLFLFDTINRSNLNWLKRYSIIEGIARGLLYLHEESRLLVVHRDLKASNVLLNAEMNPKISDFGMARLFSTDQSHANTSKIAGTYGYMPPEYVAHGHISIKTDVFSFGVLVLEIISGHKVSQAKNGDTLLSFAWKKWLEGNALSLMDTTMSDINTTEVHRCINIALLCVQENAAKRPIMSSVVLMLNSHSVTLPVPLRPAFLVHNYMDPTSQLQSAVVGPMTVHE